MVTQSAVLNEINFDKFFFLFLGDPFTALLNIHAQPLYTVPNNKYGVQCMQIHRHFTHWLSTILRFTSSFYIWKTHFISFTNYISVMSLPYLTISIIYLTLTTRTFVSSCKILLIFKKLSHF